MSRKKKTRKLGAEGPAQFVEKSVSQKDQDGLVRKKARKRKGLKAGSRHSAEEVTQLKAQGQKRDPRLGSKKPIPLVIEDKPHPKSNEAKRQRKLSAEQELMQLENDAQLNALLDRIEEGENLGAGLQKSVDEKLDRIEQLMAQLGLLEDAPEEESEDEFFPSAPLTDEERFEQFNQLDVDDFDKE
ncbi:Der GTPase-activating protein YihI [Thaumasiovibrio subtropicus]|uniref:Der GTPase-activating protein YihI n=1 Tax=Thaumasiovibrio subtropicus TaxID=1891207 RepID=UPI000B35D727|nr:Der GTPase-activating protein YihI [Thaumasiovibrio subtropicus]